MSNGNSIAHKVVTINVVDSESNNIFLVIQQRIDFLQALLGCKQCVVCKGDSCPNVRRGGAHG